MYENILREKVLNKIHWTLKQTTEMKNKYYKYWIIKNINFYHLEAARLFYPMFGTLQ
jgi:hypothetical protein